MKNDYQNDSNFLVSHDFFCETYDFNNNTYSAFELKYKKSFAKWCVAPASKNKSGGWICRRGLFRFIISNLNLD